MPHNTGIKINTHEVYTRQHTISNRPPHNTGIKNNTREVYTRQHTIPHRIDLTTTRVLKIIPVQRWYLGRSLYLR